MLDKEVSSDDNLQIAFAPPARPALPPPGLRQNKSLGLHPLPTSSSSSGSSPTPSPRGRPTAPAPPLSHDHSGSNLRNRSRSSSTSSTTPVPAEQEPEKVPEITTSPAEKAPGDKKEDEKGFLSFFKF